MALRPRESPSQLIQRHGSGFLSFFGLKGTQIEQSLGTQIVPTIGVEHFFAAADLEVVNANGLNFSSVDSGLSIPVPAGESWRLWNVSYRATDINVGSVAYVTLVISPPGGAQVSLKEAVRFTSTALISNYRDGIFLPQPVVLPAGSAIGCVLMEAPAAGSMDLNLYALIQRLGT